MRDRLSKAGTGIKVGLNKLLDVSLEPLLRGLALLLSVIAFLCFARVVVGRLTYPFDLEWMEGGMLTHSLRLLEGRPIYAAPSADFIAYIYQPLYSILVGALGVVFGLRLELARSLSVACTLIMALLLGRIVHRETRDVPIALISVGLFFGLYPLTGYWFDLARVDPLFLMLVMGGLYVARYHGAARHGWAWSALLLISAYFTKQTAVLFIPLAFGPVAAGHRWRGAAFLVVCGLLILIISLAGDMATHGWYTYYVQHLVDGEPYLWERVQREFWIKSITELPVVMVGALSYGLWRLSGRPLRELAGETWILAAAVGMVSALLTWSRPGGFVNNFLPFYVFALVPAAQALKSLWASSRRGVALGALLAVLGQFGLLAYDPRAQLPGQADLEAGRRVVALLADVNGPVLIPEHPWYAVMAGKAPSYQSMGLVDLRFKEGLDKWPADLRDRLRARYYGAVVTAWDARQPSLGSYPPELAAAYHRVETLSYQGRALESLTGTWARPLFVYRPIAASWQALGVTGGFEDGLYRGWVKSGEAFGDAPASGTLPGQLPVGGFVGHGLANSFHRASDEPQGELQTRWFRLNGTRIRFKVGGGADADRVGVQLWSDAGRQRWAAGGNTERLEAVEWDVSALQGQIVQLKVIDQSSAPWGHVLFDDLVVE